MVPAIFIYVVGIPLGFWWLVKRFKKKGKLKDPDVIRMIGWMHKPFREGCEYWLAVELMRKAILTAAIGFMARSCHYKLLMSQLIAFAFLMVFLSVKPYRKKKHHWFQAIAMTIPGLGMSWALVGRAESREEAGKGGTGYDTYGLIIVHLALIAPVLAGAIYALLSTLWMLLKAVLNAASDAIKFAAHEAAAAAQLTSSKAKLKEEKKKRLRALALKAKTAAARAQLAPWTVQETGGDGGGDGDGDGEDEFDALFKAAKRIQTNRKGGKRDKKVTPASRLPPVEDVPQSEAEALAAKLTAGMSDADKKRHGVGGGGGGDGGGGAEDDDGNAKVAAFLRGAGLGRYAAPIAEFGIDTMADLADTGLLGDDDLAGPDIGMKKGHITKLRRALAQQDAAGGAAKGGGAGADDDHDDDEKEAEPDAAKKKAGAAATGRTRTRRSTMVHKSRRGSLAGRLMAAKMREAADSVADADDGTKKSKWKRSVAKIQAKKATEAMIHTQRKKKGRKKTKLKRLATLHTPEAREARKEKRRLMKARRESHHGHHHHHSHKRRKSKMHAGSSSGPSAGDLDTLEEGEEDEEDTSVRLQKAMASHADPPADDREALTRLYTRIAPEKLGNIDGHVELPGILRIINAGVQILICHTSHVCLTGFWQNSVMTRRSPSFFCRKFYLSD